MRAGKPVPAFTSRFRSVEQNGFASSTWTATSSKNVDARRKVRSIPNPKRDARSAHAQFRNQAELDVISAAVIGGTSFSGGIGTISGAVLGAMVMYTLKYGLSFVGLASPIQDIVAGIVLIIAVGFDTINRRRVR